MINGDSACVSLPVLKFLPSPVEVCVLLLRFGRLRVESLGVPVDQCSSAVHRSAPARLRYATGVLPTQANPAALMARARFASASLTARSWTP